MNKSDISLRDRISNFLEQWHKIDEQHFVNGGEIEKLAMGIGYKASNASRRLRELENDGVIERRINNGSVEYRISLHEDLKQKYPVLWNQQEIVKTQTSFL